MAQPGSVSAQTDMINQTLSLVEAFRAFDSDNDGLISVAELQGIMGSLGYNVTEQDAMAMMQQRDTNGDGLLSIEEFLEMNTKDMDFGEIATVLRTAFEALDTNQDTMVTGEELYEVMVNMGIELSLEDCMDIIASMDGDGDGVVSFEDFKLIVNSLL